MCCAKPRAGLLALGVTLLSSFALNLASPVWSQMALAQAAPPAEPALSRIARTGILTAGTRTDARPFAYQTPDGQWLGYSVEQLERIRATLQRQLRRPIQLALVNADTDSLGLVSRGQVDIVCGSTSITANRELQVDFSVGYFVTGTQLLINNKHRLGTEFTIGVLANTTNQRLMRRSFPLARFVTFDSRRNGLVALQNQRIDALSSDGILLEAMRLSLIDSAALDASFYEVLPEPPLDEEFYGCMVALGDQPFLELVNRSLLAFMQGALAAQSEERQTLASWFGAAGTVPLSSDAWDNLLAYFQKQLHRQSEPQGESS